MKQQDLIERWLDGTLPSRPVRAGQLEADGNRLWFPNLRRPPSQPFGLSAAFKHNGYVLVANWSGGRRGTWRRKELCCSIEITANRRDIPCRVPITNGKSRVFSVVARYLLETHDRFDVDLACGTAMCLCPDPWDSYLFICKMLGFEPLFDDPEVFSGWARSVPVLLQ